MDIVKARTAGQVETRDAGDDALPIIEGDYRVIGEPGLLPPPDEKEEDPAYLLLRWMAWITFALMAAVHRFHVP